MANLRWGLSIGDLVEWETTGHGNIQRKGKIVALVPAGAAIDGRPSRSTGVSVVGDLDPSKVARGVMPVSSIDRYAIECPYLNAKGLPVKSGRTEIKLPNRWTLEKSLGINKNASNTNN